MPKEGKEEKLNFPDEPKLARKSRNSEKTTNKAVLRKASRRIGAIIVVANYANGTVALTNRKKPTNLRKVPHVMKT